MDPIPARSSWEANRSSKSSQAIGNSREKHPHILAATTKAGTTIIKTNGWGDNLQKQDVAEDKSGDT